MASSFFLNLALKYLGFLYKNAPKNSKKINSENINKAAEMLEELIVNQKGNMSATIFNTPVNKGGIILRQKNRDAVKEVLENEGYVDAVFDDKTINSFIQEAIIAGKNKEEIIDSFQRTYRADLVGAVKSNGALDKRIRSELKKINQPTLAQKRVLLQRNLIQEAADKLKKEGRTVSYPNIYLELKNSGKIGNTILTSPRAINTFFATQKRAGNPMGLTVDTNLSTAKALSERFEGKLDKRLNYQDVTQIISDFAKSNKDKLLKDEVIGLTRTRKGPFNISNFAAASKIRVDPDINTPRELIGFLQSNKGLDFLQSIPKTPKFKKLIEGKSEENITMLSEFFDFAQKKVKDSYPNLFNAPSSIQGLHSYPSRSVKNIFKYGEIPLRESDTRKYTGSIKVTDEALQDLKSLIDEKVIDVDMLPSELNQIQMMFDPKIIKGKNLDEFDKFYEELGVTTLAPKFNAKGDIISFNFIGRKNDLPLISQNQSPYESIRENMLKEAVDQNLRKFQGLKDGGFASIEEVLEYDHG